jgi:hypothetical protein
MNKHSGLFAFAFSLATLAGGGIACGGEGRPPVAPQDTAFHNPAFAGAQLITVGTPGSGCHTGLKPTFTWQATGRKMVYVGVFRSNISISDDRIVNTSDNIWAWHSGLGRAREGNVAFSDGVSVKGDTLLTDAAPIPLEQGHSYTWAVWAWNDDGTRVIASSEETFFIADTSAAPCR